MLGSPLFVEQGMPRFHTLLPCVPPHIALMGAIGKGKTTTGVQIALDIARQAGIPFLMIDPKGEFVRARNIKALSS